MKIRQTLLFIVAVLPLLALSCKKEAEPVVETVLKVKPSNLVFAKTGGTQKIAVTCNNAWTVESNDTWITVSPASGNKDGEIAVTVGKNTLDNARSGKVTIKSGSRTETVQISQEGAAQTVLEVKPSTLSFTGKGEAQKFNITCFNDWTVESDAAWITVSSTSGSGNAEISVTVGENTSDKARNGKVTVKSGSRTENVQVSQDAKSPEPLPEGYVDGYVKYSDGFPAKGVAVSDGFTVTTTDDNGYYVLKCRDDSWYIYISYPSDARIMVKSGCPDFFKRYSKTQKRYDFSFERQDSETEFDIYAMADPQAHNSARSPQKTADTERFRTETVVALNNRIGSSQHCYGVTLGDIVYSENSRNSNSGMPTMRSHFNTVKMPVFQTMGNHDYTYFYSNNPLKTDATSSTVYLKAQRQFEDTFGPINFSFNRGKVHFVCMRDINYDSTTDAGSYHGGFNNDQWEWFKADLANVPKDHMIVLCVHIPIVGLSGKENVSNVLNLMKQYKNSTIFSGHTHYYRGVSNVLSSGMYEHIHSAVCGQWWWSKIEGDGCPNGYTVYHFKGNEITDAHFYGVNDKMDGENYQMRIYRGDTKTGGSYAYFQWPHKNTVYLINIFSGDARWKVRVYENGTLKTSNLPMMSNSKQSFSSVTKGQTYDVKAASNQDWWAIGYHIGAVGRGTSSTSYYTNMFHMWKYEATSSTAKIKVEAEDPYGNVYTCEDVITNGTSYPDYIKIALK